jgi:hypothetical protein
MGRVVHALDRELQRPVAIKICPFRSEVSRERFLREGLQLARVQHPNVMEVFACGEVGEEVYMVCEYLPGRSLEDSLPDDLAPVEIMLDVASGLEAAHAAGLVHRDVKPGNILVAEGPRVVLVDFGLSLDPTRTAITATNAIVGTPAYLAPELIRGEDWSPAADWFAWATTLYELIEGDHPFVRPLQERGFHHMHDDPVRFLRTPAPVATMIEACLDLDPTRRPTSRRELETLLRSPAPTPARGSDRQPAPDPGGKSAAPGAARIAAEEVRRHPYLFAGLGVAFVVLSALVFARPRPTHPRFLEARASFQRRLDTLLARAVRVQERVEGFTIVTVEGPADRPELEVHEVRSGDSGEVTISSGSGSQETFEVAPGEVDLAVTEEPDGTVVVRVAGEVLRFVPRHRYPDALGRRLVFGNETPLDLGALVLEFQPPRPTPPPEPTPSPAPASPRPGATRAPAPPAAPFGLPTAPTEPPLPTTSPSPEPTEEPPPEPLGGDVEETAVPDPEPATDELDTNDLADDLGFGSAGGAASEGGYDAGSEP